MTLTPIQVATLQYVLDYRERTKSSPTVREIARNFGVSIPSAFDRIQSLIDSGAMKRGEPHKSRTLQVTPAGIKAIQAPNGE